MVPVAWMVSAIAEGEIVPATVPLHGSVPSRCCPMSKTKAFAWNGSSVTLALPTRISVADPPGATHCASQATRVETACSVVTACPSALLLGSVGAPM